MAARRAIKLILTLILLAMLVSTAGMLATYFVLSRGPSIPTGSTLVLRVRGDLAEVQPMGLLGRVLVAPPTVRAIVDNLRKAAVDQRVERVVVLPTGSQPLWAKAQEIRDAIVAFKASGKPIDAYLEYGGTKEYYMATAADRIFLMPTSPLELTGLASYELFLRGTLEKLGAYPDLLHIGDYKTASNLLTEQTYTPEHREMAESLNADMFDQLVRAIADGRGLPESDVRALVDRGPFGPEQALELGLVDSLAYEDQLFETEPGGSPALVAGESYARISRQAVGLDGGRSLAVIYAVGTIATGPSRYDSPQGPVLGSETLLEHLRSARDDDRIEGIILRIDSPGGSAIASDVIWREVAIAREIKPMVVSMSDVAGSGGYYIAMPAHAIVAQPGSLTGSIGVVVGKIVLGGTYAKLGANLESVSQGRFAEMHSPVRPYSADERARVEEQLRLIYDQFVAKAAAGRGTSVERIQAVAQGRVWTGEQAKDVGLVDELGGLDRAVALAKQRAGIAPDEQVELVVYPPPKSFLELLQDPWGGASPISALLRSPEARAIATLEMTRTLFRRGEPLMLMPSTFWQ